MYVCVTIVCGLTDATRLYMDRLYGSMNVDYETVTVRLATCAALRYPDLALVNSSTTDCDCIWHFVVRFFIVLCAAMLVKIQLYIK